MLIGKPGCHLCDDAREAIDRVLSDFHAANPAAQVVVEEKNILEDEALLQRYSEEIPVILIDGKMHNYWRVDEERLMRDAGLDPAYLDHHHHTHHAFAQAVGTMRRPTGTSNASSKKSRNLDSAALIAG